MEMVIVKWRTFLTALFGGFVCCMLQEAWWICDVVAVNRVLLKLYAFTSRAK